MIIDTPEGPKFEWEVDEETATAAKADIEEAANVSRERVLARQRAREEEELVARLAEESAATAAVFMGVDAKLDAPSQPAKPEVVDPDIVALAQKGDVEALRRRLEAGCTPDVVAFEFALYPGSARMYCNDWTPLSAAAVAGEAPAAELLIQALADVNVICCSSTSSGTYKYWTALDCARSGDIIPFERDHERHLQPKRPEVERLLMAAGAKPASAFPEPREVNTYGNLPAEGQRPNPCLDAGGMPLRPVHLFDPEEEARRAKAPGVPRLVRGTGGSGCPMTSFGTMEPGNDRQSLAAAAAGRTYTGGAKVHTHFRGASARAATG